MRELSEKHLRSVSGRGLYAEYSPQEISPLSSTLGYLLGVHIKIWKDPNHQSSMNGVINAVSLCARRVDVAREVTFHYFRETRCINMFTHFGCGLVMGLTDRGERRSK